MKVCVSFCFCFTTVISHLVVNNLSFHVSCLWIIKDHDQGTALKELHLHLALKESGSGSGSEVKSLSRVRLFATPWTIAYQVPLSMGFSRQ